MGCTGYGQAEKILIDNYAWEIGVNSTLLAGQHRWVNGKVPVFRDQTTLRMAATVTIGSLMLPNQQGWNVPRLYSLFTTETAHDIRSLEMPQITDPSDRPFWPLTTSGTYTTKSGYYLLSRKSEIYSMTPPLVSKFFRILWGLLIMPKWKIFIWKLWHNSLATVANLSSRGMSGSDDCPCCATEPETCQHLFRMCPLATVAWRTSQLGIISNLVTYVSLKDLLLHGYFTSTDWTGIQGIVYHSLLAHYGLYGSVGITWFSTVSHQIVTFYALLCHKLCNNMSPFLQSPPQTSRL